MEPVNYLKDMLEVAEGTIVDTVIDVGLGAAPVVGKVYQSYQIWKLQKRMTSNEQQLLRLKEKVETSENEVFYKQEIFPLIVKSLMEDDEDLKAKVIIDGFEYVIDNDLHNIERIYHYYDVLSELRYGDIMVLVTFPPYNPANYSFSEKRSNVFLSSSNTSKELSEEEAIQRYQKNKLVRLGLLSDGLEQHLTDFGTRFIKFFTVEDDTEEHN